MTLKDLEQIIAGSKLIKPGLPDVDVPIFVECETRDCWHEVVGFDVQDSGLGTYQIVIRTKLRNDGS